MTTPDYQSHNFVDGSGGHTPITAAILNDDEAAIVALHAGTLPKAYDTLTGKADGALGTTDSGQAWVATGSNTPVIRNGAITFAAGAPTGASYAQLPQSTGIIRIGGKFRFQSSSATSGNVTLGAFTSSSIPSTAPVHMSITPYGWQLSVVSAGPTFTPQTPIGGVTNFPEFANPLLCDGVTVYTVDIELDLEKSKARVSLPDGRIVEYFNSNIATLAGTYPFWETFTQSSSDVVGGWTQVWTDTAPNVAMSPFASHQATWRAARNTGDGAGAPSARPPSRTCPGSTWFDTAGIPTALAAATVVGASSFTANVSISAGTFVSIDTGTSLEQRVTGIPTGTAPPYTIPLLGATLAFAHASGATVTTGGRPTFSDGAVWRDPSGLIVGNLLSPNQAVVNHDATGFGGTGATVARVTSPAPAGRSGSLQMTATSAAADNVYTTPLTPVAPNLPITAFCNQMMAPTASRAVYVQVSYYNAASTYLSATTAAGATTSTATWQSLLPAQGVTPSNAAFASASVTVLSAAVNEVFYLTEFCLAYGAISSYLEP